MAQLKTTSVTGNLSVTGETVASKFVKSGGTSAQLLRADGGTQSLTTINTNISQAQTTANNAQATANEAIATKLSIDGTNKMEGPLSFDSTKGGLANISGCDKIIMANNSDTLGYRTKAQFIQDLKLSQVYNYKGTLASINSLISITSARVGDVYFISATSDSWACKTEVTSSTSITTSNYTTYWSNLGKNVNLSGYMTLDTNQAISGQKTFNNLNGLKIQTPNSSNASSPYIMTIKGNEITCNSNLSFKVGDTPVALICNANGGTVKAKVFQGTETNSGSIILTSETTPVVTIAGNTTVSNNLTVAGTTTLTNTLSIKASSSATTANFTVDTSGNASVSGTLTVASGQSTSLGGSLSVAADQSTSLGGTLTVASDTTLNGTLTVATDQKTTLGGPLQVASDKSTILGGSLAVSGSTVLTGTLSIKSGDNANFTVDTSGNTEILGTLDVTGNTDIQGELDVAEDTDIQGALQIAKGIRVKNGAFVVDDTYGNTTLDGVLYANKGINVNSGKFIVDDTYGNTDIAGYLKVTGNTTLTGVLNANGGITVDTDKFIVYDATGNTSVGGTLTVAANQATTLNGTLAVSGTTTLKNTASITSTNASSSIHIDHNSIKATTNNDSTETDLSLGISSKKVRIGLSTIGNTNKPLYLSSGVLTECSLYAGGTQVTLNGTGKGASTANFYAPTGAGTSGQILKSGGTDNAPTWLSILPVANGGTGLGTLTSGRALIGNGENAVSLRAITNLSSATTITANTNLITANTLHYYTGTANTTTVGTLTTGTWNATTIGVAYGGTGQTSWTANRLIYASGSTTLTTSGHYINNTKVAINSTSEPSTAFYVNGNGVFSETVTATSYYATSDVRLKQNFKQLITKKSILDLPIYIFDFIDGNKNQVGCIAQDLQKICPEIVTTDEKGYLSIQENKIVYLLLDEVKKLQAEINDLKKGK